MFYGNQALVVAFYKQKPQVSINIQLDTCIKHIKLHIIRWHTESKLKLKFHELIENTTINIKVDLQL